MSRLKRELIIVCVKLQRHAEGGLKQDKEDASQKLWEVCDKQEIQWRYHACVLFTPPNDLTLYFFRQEVAAASTQESTKARTGEMTMKANKTSGTQAVFVFFTVFVWCVFTRLLHHRKSFSGSRSVERMTWLIQNMDLTDSQWERRPPTSSICMPAR